MGGAWVSDLICTDGHLYGHQTVHGFEFTNEFSGSTPATSTTPQFHPIPYYPIIK